MNRIPHAWDCHCGTRNGPALQVCRACGAPQRTGRMLYQDDPPAKGSGQSLAGRVFRLTAVLLLLAGLLSVGLAEWVAHSRDSAPLPGTTASVPQVLGQNILTIKREWSRFPVTDFHPTPEQAAYSDVSTSTFDLGGVSVQMDYRDEQEPIRWVFVAPRFMLNPDRRILLERVGIREPCFLQIHQVRVLEGRYDPDVPGDIAGVWVGQFGVAPTKEQFPGAWD